MDKRVNRRSAAAAALVLAAMAASPLEAADAAFTVANYPVDATDKNAVAAKEKALADGQDAAFRALLKRIVPVTAYRQLNRATDIRAANMISGVAVRSERNSATEYIASLDFSFQPNAVRSALQSRRIPFVESQAPRITIIPAAVQGSPPEAKTDTGSWQQAWKALDLEHTLSPAKLDELRSVIHPDTIKMLLGGDDSAQRILAGEYQGETVLLALAETDTAERKLNVTLVGQDGVGPINLKRSYRIPDGDAAYAGELAAVISLGILEGRWKAQQSESLAFNAPDASSGPQWGSIRTGSGEPVRFIAEFASPAQWNQIRTQLLDTPGVEAVEIAAVSTAGADVALTFPGGPPALANALGARGLSLVATETGWRLRSTR